MANVAAATNWNTPNFLGALWSPSRTNVPVTVMAGGLNGARQVQNFDFPIDQQYSHEAAAQPSITETASLTAPTAISYVRSQDKNVCQIHQEQTAASYARLSATARLDQVAVNSISSGEPTVVPSELDFQIARALEKIARDFELSALQGTYQIATSAAVANKTRGLNAAASSTVAAGTTALSKAHIQAMLKAMYDAGANFVNPVFVVNSFQKMALSTLYGYAPTDRNVGGVNIKQIETDFGNIGVVLDSFQSTSVLLCADMSVVNIVTQPVPGKGNLFYEALAKVGAGELGQVYGQLGLDHGPGWYHGTITGLTTS